MSRDSALVVFASTLFFAGLFFSKALLSITTALLPLLAVAFFIQKKIDKKIFLYHPLFWFSILYFLSVLISGLYSSNTEYFLERLRIKLPFLILPLTLGAFAILNKNHFRLLKIIFLCIVMIAISFSVFNFIIDFENVMESYKYAKVLPTPIHHIRFSLLVALAAFICLTELIKKPFFADKLWYFFVIVLLICFVYLHILAVRSGLLALYGGLFLILVLELFRRKKYLFIFISCLFLIALPFLAYHTIPTFAQKYHYMKHDIGMYKAGEREVAYSDMRRLISLEAGLIAAKEGGFTGHGYGDIREAVDGAYEKLKPEVPVENRTLPHNQFLFSFIGGGVLTLLMLFLMTFFPFFSKKNYVLLTPLAFQFSQFTSFMTEHPLETQIGAAFFLFFLFFLGSEKEK